MLAKLNFDSYANNRITSHEVEGYAQVLYENYCVRTKQLLPIWDKASAYIRREFRNEARQVLEA